MSKGRATLNTTSTRYRLLKTLQTRERSYRHITFRSPDLATLCLEQSGGKGKKLDRCNKHEGSPIDRRILDRYGLQHALSYHYPTTRVPRLSTYAATVPRSAFSYQFSLKKD